MSKKKKFFILSKEITINHLGQICVKKKFIFKLNFRYYRCIK